MTRETKANLIFVIVIVAVTLPGAVMLFKKKLSATRMMYLPDPVKRGLVYMNPMPAPPSVARVVPPLTAAWVAELGGDRKVGGPVPMRPAGEGKPLPVMSQNQVFQVAASAPADDHWRLWLLAWDPRLSPDTACLSVRADLMNGPTAGVIESAEAIVLPPSIRKELQEFGFTRPPDRVVWIAVRFTGKPDPASLTNIHLNYAGPTGPVSDSVIGWPAGDAAGR